MGSSLLRDLVGQISRQFEVLSHNSDGQYVHALEGSDVKLMIEGKQDIVKFPCDLDPSEPLNPIDGLTVQIQKEGEQSEFVISVESSKREIFVPFIADMIRQFETLGLPTAFDETLEDWRKLWAGKRGRLNRSQQKGLLGELHVLSQLIQHDPDSCRSWIGPLREKALHDYVSDLLHLEIKTTTLQPPSVQISNVSQVAPFGGNAKLALIVIGIESGEDIALPNLINELRIVLGDGPNLAHFEKVLRRSGYREEHDQYYRNTYSIAFEEIHWITEYSPVLDSKILSDIPATVRDIKYTLDVFAMDMKVLTEKDWSQFASQLN